jgi:spore maturation protein CgeB
MRFLMGGACYPDGFPWTENLFFVRHLPPPEHAAFFSSCRLTLNVTRAAMAAMGHCPSGRLFEAAACGAAIASDSWDGLDAFFTPGCEVLLVRNRRDVCDALDLSDTELRRIGEAARERALAEHSAGRRAEELVDLLGARSPAAEAA